MASDTGRRTVDRGKSDSEVIQEIRAGMSLTREATPLREIFQQLLQAKLQQKVAANMGGVRRPRQERVVENDSGGAERAPREIYQLAVYWSSKAARSSTVSWEHPLHKVGPETRDSS